MTDTGPASATLSTSGDVRRFALRAGAFLSIGLLLYAAAYAAAEAIVARHGARNRFFLVNTTPPGVFDAVILGASHAAVLDYRDMNARLERLTGTRIMNLAVVGAGVDVNQLLLDYFLTRHETRSVIYVADSFAFRSAEWNERRLEDRRLYTRAPFDVALVRLLLKGPAPLGTAVDYASGFSKINDADRFGPIIPPEEGGRFDRRYRPVPQIDEERVSYLYPDGANDGALMHYLGRFDALVTDLQARGIRITVIKPPIPARIVRRLPGEARFDSELRELLDRRRVAFHDFSADGYPDELFQDPDHLNRAGVLRFIEEALTSLLASTT